MSLFVPGKAYTRQMIYRQIDRCTDRKIDIKIVYTNRKVDKCIDRKIDKLLDRKIDKCIDRNIGKCIDRKIDKCIDRKRDKCIDR